MGPLNRRNLVGVKEVKAGELALDGFEKRVWAAPHPERAGAIKAQAIRAEIIASLSDATGATTLKFDDTGKIDDES